MIFGSSLSAPAPQPETPADIAVLGSNPLAVWLAVRFAHAGHRPLLITTPAEASAFQNTEFSLKEDRTVITHRISFPADYKLGSTPELLIIACSPTELRRHLPLLNPGKLTGTTVLNCAVSSDTSYLGAFLKTAVIPAYFQGAVCREKNHLTTLSRDNSFTLSLKENNRTFENLHNLFETAGIELAGIADDRRNFWEWFIPRTAAALLAGLYRQNIYGLMKNEPVRKQLEALITELSELAAADDVLILPSDMLHTVYAFTPSWKFALQSEDKKLVTSEFGRLSTLLQNQAEASGRPIHLLRRLLDEFYNKILA